jgi:polyhydroxybutyrate depolymerase
MMMAPIISRLLLFAVALATLLTGCARGTELTVTATASDPQEASPAIDLTATLEVDGRERSYRLHVPAGLDPSAPSALVVALHGGGGNGANMQGRIGLDAVADRESFLVAYPDGSGRLDGYLLTWNAGNCCGYALDDAVNDTAFLRAMVADIASTYPIDPRRIYATGMSNGGMMAYRLACEAADLFAAVAPVAGALNLESCEPSGPVSVLVIHGTADQHVLFEGGAPAVTVDSHPRIDHSVHYALTFWAARNRCTLQATQARAGSVVHEVYPECEGGSAVELIAIEGGEHAWPGGVKFSPQGDEPSQAVDASKAIWDFFVVHPKP